MKKIKNLSIFFPAYNDSQILPLLIKKTIKTAGGVSNKFEIIVVDDGSKDNTVEVVEDLMKKFPFIRLVKHKKNSGYGSSLSTGFKNAKYDWVFYTDGDGQYDPSELSKLVDKIDSKTDVVNGYKIGRSDNFTRRLVGHTYNTFVHRFYDIPISDIDCDFRLIRKSYIEKLKINSRSGTVCLELILKLKDKGARFKEVGVNHYPRPYGKSEFFKFRNILKTLIDNIKFHLELHSSYS
ncbi:MAG: glycosyltransferase family 2 protein [Patescibacteria group bacterium]|nr:glycosyltransferase family 2 protein [Patescibacteria group bacterium]